jgi:hypothetical protein
MRNMKGTQLRKIIESTGRTVTGAADEMQIDRGTLHRYLADKLPIPRVIELVARCWERHQEPKERKS